MLDEKTKKELENQQYRIAGSHSSVKICHWTKSGLKNQGLCYKHTFYGINSIQCLQMTTSLSCPSRCIFCWRGYKGHVSERWEGSIDKPELILSESKKAQQNLLTGFGGNSKVSKKELEKAKQIKHVALSLTGEPIIYPKINDFLKLCNQDNISTFLVTNGQYPELIKNLNPVTQLYLSIDAPDKQTLKKIDNPLFKDYWERFNLSLEEIAKKKARTALRITLIKEMNDCNIEGYSELIKKADPDFIEIKGYMFVGTSRQRMTLKNMPWHEDVIEFSKKLSTHLQNYDIISEHISSRAVLLAKKEFKKRGKWHTWIDFQKWNNLINSKDEKKTSSISSTDYSTKTPEEFIGLSGKGTKQKIENRSKSK